MKKLLLFTLLLTQFLFPQLKEMEVKPTENRGGIPIFRDYPEKAGVILYTQYDNLTFYSSYGIHKVMGDPASGKYVVIIEPAKQSLEVRCPGHKSEIIKIESLQPRDVLYFEVLPKKEEGVIGIKEISTTIQVTPQDASILIDGISVKNDTPTKISVGNHTLKVEKSGYTPYIKEIAINENNTIFKVTLTSNDPVSVIIGSSPSGAEIFLDGISKGKTEKAMFLYPGEYDLRLTLSGFLPVSERVTVSNDENKNKFSYNLTRNTGLLKFEVVPSSAIIKINKEVVRGSELHELSPGIYQIEAEAETYYPYKGTIEITLGQTKTERITLTQKTGKLQFSINPYQAECVLSQNGVEKYRWTGLKIFSNIAEGTYDLTAKAQGYKSFTSEIIIKEGQTTVEDIQMTQGSETPTGFVLVEGRAFKQGGYAWSSFYISKIEVTQEKWESVMANNPSAFKGKNKPVENVMWGEAIEFCNALSEKEGLRKVYSEENGKLKCDFNANGYRLPSEAEWEFAARGGNKGKGYKYSGSYFPGDVAWYSGNSSNETNEVSKLQPNELGIYDMSGNVWEWCGDITDGNPYRLLKGGSWEVNEERCTVGYRRNSTPDSKDKSYGFRLVRTR